jgi:hypothetical protein
MLPIFNQSIIQDFNEEGNENVESEDFSPGFGCVPVLFYLKLEPPSEIKNNWTENDWENYHYSKLRDEQKQFEEDSYLKQYGI